MRVQRLLCLSISKNKIRFRLEIQFIVVNFSARDETGRHRDPRVQRRSRQATIHGWLLQEFRHQRVEGTTETRCQEKKKERVIEPGLSE